MRNILLRKCLIVSIIIMFIGVSIIPSLGGISINKQSSTLSKIYLRSFDSRAETLYVGGSGPGNYTSIQEAINNASSGDTIFVYNGTYYENLVVDKSNIDLIGEDKNTTIINGNNSGNVVYISTYLVDVIGFTITGCGGGSNDAGIKLDDTEYCDIEDNIFVNQSVGIYLIDSNAINIMYNIYSSNYQKSIYLFDSPSNTIQYNICEYSDSGFFLLNSSYNVIRFNDFSNNSVGVNVSGTSYSNEITNNVCMDGVHGFLISSTNSNILYNNVCLGNEYGVFVDSSDENEIENNDCLNNVIGIYLYNSRDTAVSENTCSNNSDSGVSLFSSSYNYIGENDCLNNGVGVSLFSSSGNLISSNDCLNNGVGVNVSGDSNGNTITNNVCMDGVHGFLISSSENNINIVTNNVCLGNEYGVFVDSSDENEIEDNDCLNNVIGIYLYNSNGTIVSDNTCSNNSDSGVSLFSSSSNLISSNDCLNNGVGVSLFSSSGNLISSNDCLNNSVGVNVSGDSNGNTITNNVCMDNIRGVLIYFSNSNNVSSNGCSSNEYGVFVDSSNENEIEGNDCSSNEYGVFVDSSDENEIEDNDCLNNVIGIYSYNSNLNVFGNNTCSNNNDDGINLSNFCNNNNVIGNIISSNNGNGIYLYTSNNNSISNNIISNENIAVVISYSNNDIISDNIIIDNSNGLNIDSSSNNNIIFNNYFNNTNNAYDYGNNIWNITKTPGMNIYGGPYLGGNYWNDYNGSDLNEDGLGDTDIPYNNSGYIQNGGDLLPLINIPPYHPSNPNPANGAIDVETNADLSWIGGDPDPGNILTYDVYLSTTSPPMTKVSANQSETSYDPGYMNINTMYYWQIVTWDNNGAGTEGPIWNFTTEGNRPPETPIISGRNHGGVGKKYSYTFLTGDPNGDDIYYFIFWGDGTYEDWIGPYDSDQATAINHTWYQSGIYTIMARAKDIYEETSEWSTLKIWMPRSKQITNSFITQLLERFPHVFTLLKFLLRIMNIQLN